MFTFADNIITVILLFKYFMRQLITLLNDNPYIFQTKEIFYEDLLVKGCRG